MSGKLHFISGLPRSGSTLLAAILRQNPAFVAGMTSPVATLFRAIENSTAPNVETSVFIDEAKRQELLRAAFQVFYTGQDEKTVFDTSRMWLARMPILCHLFPQAKFIACVRDVSWVIDSFEAIYRRNLQRPSAIYNFDTSGTVYTRTAQLAASNGIVGFALDALREAVGGANQDRILIVEYKDLCQAPRETLKKVYKFIWTDPFDHDFDNVEYQAGEFDTQLGVPGLHDVKRKVEWTQRTSILPKDLFSRFAQDNFWRQSCLK